MTWDSGIRFDLRILRFFRGPGDLDSSRDVSPRAESHFSAVWNPRSLKKVLTIVLILAVTIASWVSGGQPKVSFMGFFTIIMEVENGPLEIKLVFQRLFSTVTEESTPEELTVCS